ncbi:unnamed protein product [Zymoseptoria tritici ST99CH_3D1]|nr:unnamed protein product [Zymoseptoria tritici ST99CH_3D1]
MPHTKGRCFRCQKKGHVAAICPSRKPKNTSGLAGLPTELIALIATQLMYDGYNSWPYKLRDLRLTCRAVYEKTHDAYLKAAFGRLFLQVDPRGLNRLGKISQCPLMADKVRSIRLSQYDGMSKEEVSAAERDSISAELTSRERRDARAFIRRANHEQDDKEFIERSGTIAILLATSLPLLPNLQEITVNCEGDNRKQRRRLDFSPNDAFSVISGCLPFAGAKLQKFAIPWYEPCSNRGVSLQALRMPQRSLACFSELRVLELLLRTRDGERYRNPKKWMDSAATFLSTCSQLRELRLAFGNDWEETAVVFHHIAEKAIFVDLEIFNLDFVRCRGADLLLFLDNHNGLRSISLNNLDIVGSVGYSENLDHLRHHHSKLEEFSCSQIAQNSFRTFFESYGELQFQTSPTYYSLDDFVETNDFFSDFVDVVGPFKYTGRAAQWEGVQYKIRMLKDDLRISGKGIHSDLYWPGKATYYWTK